MHGLILIFSVVFSVISPNFGIPYDDFQINVVKSGGEVGQFETQLRASMHTTKNFFARDDVKLITNGVSAGLKSIIGPVASALPMVQSALSKESDWKEPLIKTIASQEKRALMEAHLDDIEIDSTQISGSIKQLNVSLIKNSKNKSDVERMKDISNVAIVQDKLINIIARFASGNSLFKEYPELSTGPLLGLSVLVSLFTPIRDMIYENKTDESIISCKLCETLAEYFPLVLHWRLKSIYSVSDNPVPDYVIYSMVFEPGAYLPGGGGLYYHHQNKSDVRCDRNACDSERHIICLKDKMQDDSVYSGFEDGASFDCLVDYLFLIRTRVQELFDTAIELSNSTCSNALRGRQRDPTGYGWWTFTKMTYWAFGDMDGKKCDVGFTSLNEACDVYIRIYINDKLDLETKKHENEYYGSYTLNYKTPKISKKSHIRIEMWDDDSGFFGSDDDALLKKTLTIDELTKNRKIDIKAGTTNSIDNHIELDGSAWKDEYQSL